MNLVINSGKFVVSSFRSLFVYNLFSDKKEIDNTPNEVVALCLNDNGEVLCYSPKFFMLRLPDSIVSWKHKLFCGSKVSSLDIDTYAIACSTYGLNLQKRSNASSVVTTSAVSFNTMSVNDFVADKENKIIFSATQSGAVSIFYGLEQDKLVQTGQNLTMSYAYSVDLLEDKEFVILTTVDGIFILASKPNEKGKLLQHSKVSHGKIGFSVDVKTTRDRAFIAGGADGIYVLDIVNPRKPKKAEHFKKTTVTKLHVYGNMLFTYNKLSRDMTFSVFDISKGGFSVIAQDVNPSNFDLRGLFNI